MYSILFQPIVMTIFIDKKLELLSVDGENRILNGYDDTKVYIETLKTRKSELFA